MDNLFILPLKLVTPNLKFCIYPSRFNEKRPKVSKNYNFLCSMPDNLFDNTFNHLSLLSVYKITYRLVLISVTVFSSQLYRSVGREIMYTIANNLLKYSVLY